MMQNHVAELMLWLKVEKREWVGIIAHVIIKWHNDEKHKVNEDRAGWSRWMGMELFGSETKQRHKQKDIKRSMVVDSNCHSNFLWFWFFSSPVPITKPFI